MKALPKWNEEREELLKSIVGTASPVTVDLIDKAAEQLETSTKSVAAKLRKMNYTVESMAKVTTKSYTDAEEAELRTFLEANPGKFTYAEIAAAVLNGTRNAKQIQGKILSMDATSLVKPTPRVERVKTYTDAEEAKLMRLLENEDAYIEDIADAMNRDVSSVRGKILSITRTEAGKDIKIPKQRTYKSKDVEDPIVALGDISGMTVQDIAEAIEKSPRGVKIMLTRRALVCKDYNGEKRAEKIAATA